jgi:malonyl-CoA O-methyltransferase
MRRNFSRAAAGYDAAAVLQREVATRMLERLELIRATPGVIVDVGCGTGYATAALLKKYRKARIIDLDIALAMLQIARKRAPWLRKIYCVCADAAALPLADASCDILFSNLMLQWCVDPDRLLAEVRRVLKPGGVLMFSTLGPDTLIELRRSWAAADRYPHVHLFIDMHDIGDALLRAQLADPVMDTEHITLTYQTVRELPGSPIPQEPHHAQKDLPLQQCRRRLGRLSGPRRRAASVARHRRRDQDRDRGGVHAHHRARPVLYDPHARRRVVLQVGQ